MGRRFRRWSNVRPVPGRARRLGRAWSKGEEEEARLCHPGQGAAGFIRFCDRHVTIQDRETGESCPFRLWPGQRRIAPWLTAWHWMISLKGRQLGVTWLIVAYLRWRIRYERFFYCPVVNQSLPYAYESIDRIRWIDEHLPPFLRQERVKDSEVELKFRARGQSGHVAAKVGGKASIRSLTGECTFYDEASYIAKFKDTLSAVIPMMRRSAQSMQRGQILVASTSDGPLGEFAAVWHETFGQYGELLDDDGKGPTGFRPVFLHWSERPGREDPWYAETKAALDRINPFAMKREHPDSIAEAFEFAEGRLYPHFSVERNVGELAEVPDTADRFRAIDWGDTKSAYVCLWILHVPGPPGVLVSPACPNTIRELLEYRWDDARGRPAEECDDHACDALRYAVVTHGLTGLVYVYREIYERETLTRGWSPMEEIRRIHEASGWVRRLVDGEERWRPGRRGERYTLNAVADRSIGKLIELYCQFEIPTIPAARPSAAQAARVSLARGKDTDSEVNVGIRLVSALMHGSEMMDRVHEITRHEAALDVWRRVRASRMPVAGGMAERKLLALGRELIAARRRGKL